MLAYLYNCYNDLLTQVEPAARRLLQYDRPKYLAEILGLLEDFAIPDLPLPKAMNLHFCLLVPPRAKPTGNL